MKRKVKFLLVLSATFLFSNVGSAQSKTFSIQNDTITFNLQRVAGLGPNGNMSFSTRSYADYKNTEDILAFPVVKNIPQNLTNTAQYVYFLDEFQFYYQNYVAGVLSKSFFKQKAELNNWKLADTINLSIQPVKCAFTVFAGVDPDKNEVYLVDANNNNDYSDDVMRPLLKNVNTESTIVKNAISVKISFLDKDVTRDNDILVFIQRARDPNKMDIMLTFPQFDYVKFSYKGTPYVLCALKEFGRKFVCVIPDRPYFTNVDRSDLVTPNHFVTVSGTNFKVLNYDFNNHIVTISGNTAGFTQSFGKDQAINDFVASHDSSIVSDQEGFLAPPIKGKNINPLLDKSLQVTLGGLRGKYVFVDFWSTYCGPCIAELPDIKAVYDKYPRSKFEIIGVFDERNKTLTNSLLLNNKVAWPNILMNDKSTDIAGYGHVNSFPTSYFIDPSGRIIAYNLRHEDLMNRLKSLMGY